MIGLARVGVLALVAGLFAATGATDTGRTFRRAWKGGENKLVGSVSRANTGNLPQPRADRPEPRRFDCRWLYRGRSKGQSAGQKHRVRHHQARKGARS